MLNALTIDIEDYWSVFFRDWLNIEAEPSDAVVKNTEWFLRVLADHNVKATFFILGEVAQCFPELIKGIVSEGHEIAVHGFYHRQIFKLSHDEFKKEVGDAKKLLEDLTGRQVLGHRAPAFSVNKDTQWALEVLLEEGFKYDSSVYPISGRCYGWTEFSKEICKVDLPSGRSIIEVPLSTVTVLGKTLPVTGGGYIRHFPYVVTKCIIKHIQKQRPVIVYMHPHEIDTELRLFTMEKLNQEDRNKTFRHHKLQLRNRHTVSQKINKLLSQFEFAPLRKVIFESPKVTFG